MLFPTVRTIQHYFIVPYRLVLLGLVLLILNITTIQADTRTWTNSSSDGLWNTAANWSPSGVPTSQDTVYFNNTNTSSCTMNTSPSIKALFIQSTYSGVVNLSSNTLTVTNAFNVQGSSSLNSSTSTLNVHAATGVFAFACAQSLYNLTIDSVNTFQYNATVSSNVIVQNNFVLNTANFMGSGFFGTKRISVFGNASSYDADGWSSTGIVMMSGSANQQLLGNGQFTQFIVNKSGGELTLANYSGNFGQSSGGYFRTDATNTGSVNLAGVTTSAFVFQHLGGTISGSGTLTGDLTTGNGATLSPGGTGTGCITVDGNVTMQTGSILRVDINGTVACSQYDQLVVNGTVTLQNPTLSSGTTFQTIAPVTIIDNDDSDAISGTFNSQPDGSQITLSSKPYTITYAANSDNDVILTTVNQAPVALCNWIDKGIVSECVPFYINETMANSGSYDPDGGPISLSISSNGPFGTGFFTVDLTVTDTMGAQSMCTAIVNVYDTVAPTIVTQCPNTIVVCGSQAVTWTEPEAIDEGNCTVTRYRSSSDVGGAEAPGDVFPVGTTEILYQWEGGGSPATSCSFFIVVHPLPDVSITQSQLSGACQGAKLLTADVANLNSMPQPILYTWSGVVSANTQSVQATQNGTYTVTVTNGADCYTTESVTLTVDNTDPVPTVANLNDITAQCAVTITTAPTATDNCAGIITGTTTDPLTYSAQGSYTITWTYDDGNGNIVTQDQEVIIADTTAPVVNLSTVPTIEAQCSATVTAPTATDNCSGTITGTTTDPITYSTQGTYNINWEFDDGNGNTSTYVQTITIDDTTAPVADTPALSTVYAQCSTTINIAPTATDNCVGTITGTTTDPLSYSAQGTYVVNWLFDDGNGNTITQTQTVVIQDTIAPIPDVQNLPTIYAQCSVTVQTTPTATDNCVGTITGTTTNSLTYATQGTHQITWVYSDGNGNTSTQIQTIVIDDTTAPTPSLSALPVLRGQCSLTISTFPTATDNCVGSVTATTTNPLTYTTPGTRTITWTYNDGNGNVTTQQQTVIVADTIAPDPNVSSLAPINGQCSVTITTRPTATDNCSGTIVATTTNPLTYTTQGTYTITWRYTDAAGNVRTQTQSVVVQDNTPPTPNQASLPDIVRNCNAYITSRPYATDNCGGCNNSGTSVRATTNSPIWYPNAGTYTIVWVYTDARGNSTTQNQTVVVVDNTAPVPNTTSLPTIRRQCSYTVGMPYPSANDNCRGNIAGSPSQTSFNTQGTHTLVWTYTDNNGNVTTQNQTIIIQDTIKPSVSCRGTNSNSAVSIGLNSNGTLALSAINANSLIHFASDNCSGTPSLSLTSTRTSFGCEQLGQTFAVTVRATDAVGNYSECTSNIRIVPGNGNDDDCDGVHNVCDECDGGNDAIDNNNDGYPDCKYPPAFADIKQSWKNGNSRVWVWYRNSNNYNSTLVQYSQLQNLINTNQVWLGGASHCGSCKIVADDSTSIDANSTTEELFTLQPNPVSAFLSVQFSPSTDDRIALISDALGNIVFKQTILANESMLAIDVTSTIWANGTYTLSIQSGTSLTSKRFVVLR